MKAGLLEQAERISRSMVEVRAVVDALLLAADPAWAGAINTVLVKKGVRVSELPRTEGEDLRLTEGCNISGGYTPPRKGDT